MWTYLAAGLAASLVVLLLLAEFHEEIADAWLIHWDTAIQSYVHAHASRALTPWMKALTEIGAPRTDLPLCGVVAGLLWWKQQRRSAALLLSSMLGAGVLVTALKLHFKRIRPDLAWRWGHEHSYSFPSGHSLMAIVLYGTLLYLFVRWLDDWWKRAVASLLALTLALGIGLSRIYLGAHYPSDVAAGYLAGSVWLVSLVGADLIVRRELQTWIANVRH